MMANKQPGIDRTTRIVVPTAMVLLLLIGLLIAVAHDEDNHPPLVSNVHAEQRLGTKLVDITYDVSDPDGDLLRITVSVSDVDGVTFTVPVQSFTGDIGGGHCPGHWKANCVGCGNGCPQRVRHGLPREGYGRRWAGWWRHYHRQ